MELEAERSGVHCQPSYSNGRYSFSKKKKEKQKTLLECCWLSYQPGGWLQGGGRSSRTEAHVETCWVREVWAVAHLSETVHVDKWF